jgi:MFS family permease
VGATAATEWRRFWFLPLVAGLGYASSVLHIYGIGPYIEPLQQEFGWSRAQISGGLTITSLLSGIFCIPIGMLVDRVGPRRVALLGVLLMSGSFALLGTATGEHSNWLFLWGVVAIGTLFVQSSVWTSAVASRFEASRGIALAITLSGASVAATVFPLIATWLIGNYGWQSAFVATGALWAALVFPLLLLFFRGALDERRIPDAPQSKATPAAAGVGLAEGLRSPVFFKLLTAAGLFAFTVMGALVHFVPILTDSGAEPLAAAGIASLIGIFSVVGRLGTGFLLDRLPGNIVGAASFVIPIFGCALLLLDGANPISQAFAAAIFGLTVGSEVDVIAYLAARHFGLKNFGALYGALNMALALGIAAGPLAAGAVFDRYDTYEPFLLLTTVLAAVSALALFSLGPAPKLAETTPLRTSDATVDH